MGYSLASDHQANLGLRPWIPPPWITTDDRIRGGISQSHVSALPSNSARFYGHLDTSTLGGAGFASQFCSADADENWTWDLSKFDGIEVVVEKGDGKVYTLILKDVEQAAKREDGREKAGVSWEVEFRAGQNKRVQESEKYTDILASEDITIWVPWSEFKATYRGKEKKDAGELKRGEIRKLGLMMRR